jgi:AraC-like DNA-binding protein
MPRPLHETPSPSALGPGLFRYLRSRGVDPAPLASRFGLRVAEDEDSLSLPPSVLSDLLEATADALGEPFLGLSLPDLLPLRGYGFAEITAQSSSTLGEALERLARYAPLIHPDLEGSVERDATEARWIAKTPRRVRGANRHVHEYALAYVLAQLRRGGSDPAVRRAWFSHARPPHLGPLEEFFGTRELRFGCEDNGFAMEIGTLSLPMRGKDPRLLATVEGLAEQALRSQARGRSFASLVEARLEGLLPGKGTLEAIAEAMHMSSRTLQRRLEQDGTGFSEVLDRVRERLARQWLRDTELLLMEVGYKLGFSDLATFSRAFKRWTGIPPGTWRQSQKSTS